MRTVERVLTLSMAVEVLLTHASAIYKPNLAHLRPYAMHTLTPPQCNQSAHHTASPMHSQRFAPKLHLSALYIVAQPPACLNACTVVSYSTCRIFFKFPRNEHLHYPTVGTGTSVGTGPLPCRFRIRSYLHKYM